MNRKLRICLCAILAIMLIIVDRITKIWASNTLKNGNIIWIIKKALCLYYLPNGNTGAAWGMLSGQIWLFVVITIVVVILIGYTIYNIPTDKKYNFIIIMLTFIAAGGLGNMYDRVFQGYVIDFIYFSLINFPIFNVADIYVSVCTVLLALYLLIKIKEEDMTEIETSLKAPLNSIFKNNE